MLIEVNQLQKRYGHHRACNNVSFRIDQGKLIGLLGPSGGGKTTILRMLAGLEHPDAGDIFFNGQRMNDVAPQERGIGFVFQSYALFKHMTIQDNIAFGLTILKEKKSKIKQKVEELITLTGLLGLEHRYPDQLSGGQRQRVAFARALALEPQLLLLDEPFAAIDAKVRKELRLWLKQMITRVGVTTIFVTHDQAEAIEVADEIIIINEGRLEQVGTPIAIYNEPQTPFVAQFIGESIMIEQPSALKGFESLGKQVKAMLRPEFVDAGKEHEISVPSAAERGIVNQCFFRGSHWLLEIRLGSQVVHAHRSLQLEPLQPGEEVLVLIHQLFIYDQAAMTKMTNQLKYDPMPVFI